ncbi:MAG: hypothetical protein MI674_02320 [Cytophagales bacterium]|nr:hypothetical protein [Cytophagales bacterium]
MLQISHCFLAYIQIRFQGGRATFCWKRGIFYSPLLKPGTRNQELRTKKIAPSSVMKGRLLTLIY